MKNRLAEDWVALWRSELTAMAADRELRESWTAMVTFWAGSANALTSMIRSPYDKPAGNAYPAKPAGATPVAAASKLGVDEVGSLNRRIAELEERLAELERTRSGPGT